MAKPVQVLASKPTCGATRRSTSLLSIYTQPTPVWHLLSALATGMPKPACV